MQGTIVHKRERLVEGIGVVALMLVGAYMRLMHLPSIDMDGMILGEASGGLFLAFADSLASNGFIVPPVVAHYTDGGIPFAYPPLAFYLEAVLVHVLGLPAMRVVHILPPVLAVLALPSFYLLVRVLRFPVHVRLFGLFAFATLPQAFSQQIQPEGLAEATGLLALIWLSIALRRLYDCPELSRWQLFAGLALGLCVMASPGSAYGAVVMCAAFAGWMMVVAEGGGRLVVLGRMALVAAVGLVVSSAYLAPSLINHGPDVFFASFVGQHSSPVLHVVRSARSFLGLALFSSVSFVFLGFMSEAIRRRFWIIAWFVALYMIPREGPWMAFIPGSILIGIGMSWLVSTCLDSLGGKGGSTYAYMVTGAVILVIAAVGLYIGRGPASEEVRRDRVPAEAVEMLESADDTLPVNAKVLTLVNEDWSPLLMRRDVVNMRYGNEWQPHEGALLGRFRNDSEECGDWQCVLAVARMTYGYAVFYVVVTDQRLSELCGEDFECGDSEVIDSAAGLMVVRAVSAAP